jgi:hypothetical protein
MSGIGKRLRRPTPALLVGAARDRDRRIGLGARAIHVEAAVARRDIVAVEQPHPLDAARSTPQHVVLRQREDDGGGTCDQIEELRRRFAAVGLGEQLVGIGAAGAAERDLLGLGMRQVDQVGCGLADADAVDLVLELARQIVAAVGARRRGAR